VDTKYAEVDLGHLTPRAVLGAEVGVSCPNDLATLRRQRGIPTWRKEVLEADVTADLIGFARERVEGSEVDP
jgi:hypothetical protein